MYRLAYLFFAVCIATVVWFGWYVQSTIAPMTATVVTALLGKPPPNHISVLLGFDTPEGQGIEIFDTKSKLKLSILTPYQPGKALGDKDVVLGLIDKTENDFARRYLRAQMDPKRANGITSQIVQVHDKSMPADFFLTNQGSHWALGEWRGSTQSSSVVFLAMHKGSPVDPAALAELLSLVKVLQ